MKAIEKTVGKTTEMLTAQNSAKQSNDYKVIIDPKDTSKMEVALLVARMMFERDPHEWDGNGCYVLPLGDHDYRWGYMLGNRKAINVFKRKGRNKVVAYVQIPTDKFWKNSYEANIEMLYSLILESEKDGGKGKMAK